MLPKLVHRILLASALLALGALAVGGVTARVQAAPLAQAAKTVRIQHFAFNPTPLTVAVGTTVTWMNQDPAPHTATARNGAFDTGTIASGASKALTMNTAGSFEYFCKIHPRMVARLMVQPAPLPSTGASGPARVGLAALGVLALLAGVAVTVGRRQGTLGS